MRRPSNHARRRLRRLLDLVDLTPAELKTFLRDNGYRNLANQIAFGDAPAAVFSAAIEVLSGAGALDATFFDLLVTHDKLLRRQDEIARVRVAFEIDEPRVKQLGEERLEQLLTAAGRAGLQSGSRYARLVRDTPHELRQSTSGPQEADGEWVAALFRAANRQVPQPGDRGIWLADLLGLCDELSAEVPEARTVFRQALAELQLGYLDDPRALPRARREAEQGGPLVAPGGALEAIVIDGGFQVDAGAMQDWLARARARTCLIRVGGADKGTGLLVGPDLVLTNWHVLAKVIKGSMALGKTIGGTVSATTVRFVFDYTTVGGDKSPTQEAQLAAADAADQPWLLDWTPAAEPEMVVDPDPPRDHETSSDEIDFALVRLDREIAAEKSQALAKRGHYRITDSPFGFEEGAPILVAGHPVVEKDNGTIYSKKKEAKRLVCSIAGRASMGANPNGPRVRYRTNTSPGSSGSPVFNDAFELVALHHFGRRERYNQGIPIAAIYRRLERQGKLAALGH